MNKIFEALRPFIRSVIRRPGLYLALAVALAVAGGLLASRLRIDSDFSKLIPSSYSSVQALERLRDAVGGESDASVVIESPSFEDNRRFAEALIPRVLALKGEGRQEPYFTHVDYRKDVSFLQRNALYFATNAELDSLEHHIQAKIEDAKLEANPFFFDLEEEETTEPGAPDSSERALRVAYNRLVGKEYPISDDSTAMVLRFYPSGSQTDIGFIRDAYTDLEKLIEEIQPKQYNAQMEITLAGRLLRQKVEVEAITEDVGGSFGVGVSIVLLFVAAYFTYKSYRARAGRRFDGKVLAHELLRSPVLVLVVGVPLFASLAWTFGLAWLVFGSLNLMTATLGLLLFGMGIDYGIHFYGRYTEERAHGRTAAEAVEITFVSSGEAIAATAFTTAAAFFLLMMADFKGFSEFGFIAGTGLLFALVAMTVVMPAFLVLAERLKLLDFKATAPALRDPSVFSNGRAGRSRMSTAILGVTAVAIVASLASLPGVAFEYDFGKLDPVYEEYQALQNKVRQVYNDSGRRNPAYIVLDDPAEAPAVEAAIRARMAADTVSPSINTVETLQSRFPFTPEAEQAKLARIAEIRAMLDDPLVQAEGGADFDRLRLAASTVAPIAMAEVPEYLRATFTSKDGQIGRLVIIYPSKGLSHGKNSIEFAEDVAHIEADGKEYHAGSTSLVAADMLRLMLSEAPTMILLTVLLIIALKWFTLRSVKWAFIALVPLGIGFLFMFGLMALFDIRMNFYNLVVLPTVLGLGDDAGIHIVHRYMEEGRGSIMRVIRSTGEHIFVSSATTLIGFGGLLLSTYPGIRSIGELAVAGIASTLVTALVVLPAIIIWLERRTPALMAVPAPVEPHAQPAMDEAV